MLASRLRYLASPWVIRLAALVTFGAFLVGPVRSGWTRFATDFPNYYTAARLVTEGQPLRRFYDWTWFGRQQSIAGYERFVGAWSPQTPLGMLPYVPVSKLPPQLAKQAWIAANVVFLAAVVMLLSGMTLFRPEKVWLLLFISYFSLNTNFLYGQYYVFLLLLLTGTCYLLHRGRNASAGAVAGVAFGLKLYGAPFLLYFLVKRNWRAVAGMGGTMAAMGALCLLLFGLSDTWYYLTQILPRSLDGGAADVYYPGNQTLSTMLRRSFMFEPALNPDPMIHAPRTFFFLRTLTTGAVMALLALGLRARGEAYDRRQVGWLLVSVLLLSTNLSSYTFLLLGLPVVLILDEQRPVEGALLIGLYALLAFPLGSVVWFPKVWLALILFAYLGREYWQNLPRRLVLAATATVVALAFVDAFHRSSAYAEEPSQRFERIAVEPALIVATSPAITRDGLFYQTWAPGRYVLHWSHDSRIDTLMFEGSALNPVSSNGALYFELVARGVSTTMRLNPATRTATPAPFTLPLDPPKAVASPDGKWIAFVTSEGGPDRIWIRSASTLDSLQLTAGTCNSHSPAWELDSRHIVFASDCSRSHGLPALYRAPIPQTAR